jgi:uroporphyrin-III C-methyltransferase
MRSKELEGEVFLVGAGPGAPDLITLRGRELIGRADVIVHDSLVPMELLALAPDGTEIIDVGKRAGCHKADQDEINRILVEKAKDGNLVVRLKGGDPFIFGRGGEEAEMLIKEGIKVHLVPGVTSAISVPGLAGIPVTHRDHSSTVTFVTGHEGAHMDRESIDWSSLAKLGGTIVILMGVSNLRSNMDHLIEGGMDPSMPVAVIEKGVTSDQRVIVGDLAAIADLCEREEVQAPSIIVVGGVTSMRKWLGDLE